MREIGKFQRNFVESGHWKRPTISILRHIPLAGSDCRACHPLRRAGCWPRPPTTRWCGCTTSRPAAATARTPPTSTSARPPPLHGNQTCVNGFGEGLWPPQSVCPQLSCQQSTSDLVFDAQAPPPPPRALSHSPVNDVTFSLEGKWLGTANMDGTIKLWPGGHRALGPHCLGQARTPLFRAASADTRPVGPGQAHVVGVCRGRPPPPGRGAPGARDVASGQFVTLFGGAHNGAEVTSLQFSKNGRHLLSSGKDGQTRLWDINGQAGPGGKGAAATIGHRSGSRGWAVSCPAPRAQQILPSSDPKLLSPFATTGFVGHGGHWQLLCAFVLTPPPPAFPAALPSAPARRSTCTSRGCRRAPRPTGSSPPSPSTSRPSRGRARRC